MYVNNYKDGSATFYYGQIGLMSTIQMCKRINCWQSMEFVDVHTHLLEQSCLNKEFNEASCF